MSFINTLRRVMQKYGDGEENFYKCPVNKQLSYLNSFSEPQDDLERAYFQYKCTLFRMKWYIRFAVQCASFFLAGIYVLKFRMCKLRKKEQADAVFVTNAMSEAIIPDSLRDKYKNIARCKFMENMYLSKSDIVFLMSILKTYPFDFYFIFKNILKLAMYSGVIHKYEPKAIISYTENAFTSTIMTKYCEDKGIKHINVMHGEKIINIKDSFARFSKYYVWDKHYVDLLSGLRFEKSQFQIELPPSIKNININKEIKPKYYITYYLEDEGKEVLTKIRDVLLVFKDRCSVRLHPRATNTEIVNELFEGFNIQTKDEVTIQQSLENTEYVVSLNSTVLFEGWMAGRKVIIDDISRPDEYKKLRKLGYIMMNKEHYLLSNILEDVVDEKAN